MTPSIAAMIKTEKQVLTADAISEWWDFNQVLQLIITDKDYDMTEMSDGSWSLYTQGVLIGIL
jgi:hypothetical protein